jgi:hypothetical protein
MSAYTNSVNFILCTFNSDPFLSGRKILNYFNEKSIKVNLFVISNSPNHKISTCEDFILVQGSNSCLDISAYYEGLVLISSLDLLNSFTIVCNDNLFFKHHWKFSIESILKYQNVSCEISSPVLIGYRSFYSSICLTNPWSSSYNFLPTYFFALNESGLSFFKKLYEDTILKCVSKNDYDYIFNSNLVPLNLKYLIFAHLQNQNSPISWHGLSKYSCSNNLVKKKMNCVFFEHYLSGKFGLEGVIIYLNTSRRYILMQFFKDYLQKMVNLFIK